MVNFIAPLRRARRVDQFSYLICPNRTPNEKVVEFENLQISEPTHTGQTDFAYRLDRYK
jgi:hypothetical protein